MILELLDTSGHEAARTDDPEADLGADDGGSGRRAWVCRLCRHLVTRESSQRSVDGGHEHAFANPSGYMFHIGCFSSAPGCRVTGTPTREHSWFSGYAWSYAYCLGCQMHLGWFFSGGPSSFFGLILKRLELVQPDEEEPT